MILYPCTYTYSYTHVCILAGKTTTINMLVGFTQPSHGTATIEGFDITKDMDRIYTLMGVCPQHDILWETLTARQHMMFYGRLKNLKGKELQDAVVDGLKQVCITVCI